MVIIYTIISKPLSKSTMRKWELLKGCFLQAIQHYFLPENHNNVVDVDVSRYLGKAEKVTVTGPIK